MLFCRIDSINDSVLTKLVARPFKQALAELDADADGLSLSGHVHWRGPPP